MVIMNEEFSSGRSGWVQGQRMTEGCPRGKLWTRRGKPWQKNWLNPPPRPEPSVLIALHTMGVLCHIRGQLQIQGGVGG